METKDMNSASRLTARPLTRLPFWVLVIAVLFRATLPLSAATNDLSTLLQKGLFEEEANHNLEAATQAYQSVVSNYDKDRKLAATAVFRLGEVFRKQGKTNEAKLYYERVLREFPEQKVLADLSRQYLPTTTPASNGPSRFEQPLGQVMNPPSLIDNRHAEFLGVWRVAGVAADRHGDDYRFSPTITTNKNEISKASFRPAIPHTGKYHVEIWYPSGENRSTNSRWMIFSAEEKELPPISVNQQTNGGKWLRIASDVHFVQGTALVQLHNITGETNAIVVADAVRVVPADGQTTRTAKTSPDKTIIGGAIVDNPFATFTGSWTPSQAWKEKYGEDYRFASSALGENATATYIPNISEKGEYYVDVWYVAGENRSHAVPYTIQSANGTKTVFLDQTKSGAKWVRLSNEPFTFEPGTNHFVRLSNKTKRTGEVVIADAIRFVPANGVIADETEAPSSSVPDEEAAEIRRIQKLVRNSPDLINATTPNDMPLLHQAAAKGQLEVVRFLLDSGADVNRGLSQGAGTAMHYAAMAGNKAMVDLLLSRGADVNAADSGGSTALHHAASRGFRTVAETLLANKANPNAKTRNNTIVLHEAITHGHVAIISLLLKHGADVNGARSEGDNTPTPLNWAVQKKQPEAARVLIEHKADVDAVSKDNYNKSGVTPLHEAVKIDHVQLAELLLKAGANPNFPINFNFSRPTSSSHTYEKVTPLHMAVMKDAVGMTELLLKYKADPNARDVYEVTPLHRAASVKVAELLLNHGADINAATKDRYTPLLFALGENSEKSRAIARLLIEKGANPNILGSDGNTPLHTATVQHDKEMVELLLKAKAEPNIESREGKTPLDLILPIANNSSNPRLAKEIIKLLVENGADEFRTRKKQISLTRDHAVFFTPFYKMTNVVNRFTLLELIAEGYGSTTLSGPGGPVMMYDAQQHLAFPDFSRIKIHRLSAPTVMTVDLRGILESGKRGEILSGWKEIGSRVCTNDIWLAWGDIVELPEANHRLSERWSWPAHEVENLKHCLKRRVEVEVNGDRKPFLLVPSLRVSTISTAIQPASADEPPPTDRVLQTFWARQLIQYSGMLLTSSDLSRVKITRINPITSEKEIITADMRLNPSAGPNSLPTDVWLGHGDVIEIPDRDPNAPPVELDDINPFGARTIPTRTLRVPPSYSPAPEPSAPPGSPPRTLRLPGNE